MGFSHLKRLIHKRLCSTRLLCRRLLPKIKFNSLKFGVFVGISIDNLASYPKNYHKRTIYRTLKNRYSTALIATNKLRLLRTQTTDLISSPIRIRSWQPYSPTTTTSRLSNLGNKYWEKMMRSTSWKQNIAMNEDCWMNKLKHSISATNRLKESMLSLW